MDIPEAREDGFDGTPPGRGSRRGRFRRTPATPPQAPLRKPPPHFPVRGVSASFPGIPYAISCNNLFVLSILPHDRMLQRRLALRRQRSIAGIPFPKPDGLRACSPSPHLFVSPDPIPDAAHAFPSPHAFTRQPQRTTRNLLISFHISLVRNVYFSLAFCSRPEYQKIIIQY